MFYAFLVSFGIIWKYLTLTGTIWAQFYTATPTLFIIFTAPLTIYYQTYKLLQIGGI